MSWMQHKLEGYTTALLPAPKDMSQPVTFDWGTVGTKVKGWDKAKTVNFKENSNGNNRD
jgi:hypothetical protein